MDLRFIDVLVERGALSQEALSKAKEEAAGGGISLEDAILARGIPEKELLEAKGVATGVPTRVVDKKRVVFDVLKMIPEE